MTMPHETFDRPLRTPTRLTVQIECEGRAANASMLDISEHGAKLWAGRPLTPGARMTLRYRARCVDGEVKWSGRNVAGVRFDAPLPASVVNEFAIAGRSAGG